MNPDNPLDEHRSPFSNEALREIAKEKVLWKLGVQIHAIAFVFVNLLLIAIDVFLVPGVLWFPYTLSSWVTGLVIHITVYLVYSRGVIGSNRRGLIMSTVSVIMAAQSLFVINYFSGFSYMWFLWPVGALIAAMLVYIIVYTFILRLDSDKSVKGSWLDKKIDSELRKVEARG